MWNLVIILGVFLGVYYGFRSKFVQFKLFPQALRIFIGQGKEKAEDGVSGFQALWITLGGAIGTGNVAGVAMAIVTGGPGAVFWMWLIALLGMTTSFIENTLAQVYKVREGNEFKGGPSYYMDKALDKRWLGNIYALFMIVSLGFALAALQANTISLTGISIGIPVGLSSAVIALLIGMIIFGGVKRIATVAEKGVPVMTLIYFILTLIIVLSNVKMIPGIFKLIFTEAFTFKSFSGGLMGTAIYQGLKRGVFSNGAGQGDAPTVGASATVSHPAVQGMYGMVAVFVDTIIVCTLTAFAIIISEVYLSSSLVGIELSQFAYSSMLGNWSKYVFALCIYMFCFTSIMANYYCGESSLSFLKSGDTGRTAYRVIFVVAIFLGGITGVDLMWNIADLFCAILVCLNMSSLVLLGKQVLLIADDYISQTKAGIEPSFSPGKLGLSTNIECWTNEADLQEE